MTLSACANWVLLAESARRSVIALPNGACKISGIAHYLNPRGYTWQTYLRKAWWRLALLIGVGVWLIWWATSTEQVVFGVVISAVALLDFGWKQFGRYVREGWRSQ